MPDDYDNEKGGSSKDLKKISRKSWQGENRCSTAVAKAHRGTGRRADTRRSIEIEPAPNHTKDLVSNQLRCIVPIMSCFVLSWFGNITILTPLPEVAMEIEQTEIVGFEAADRLCSVG